ncbi:MAG: hypothetical protein B1H03_00820 [Planctomycetales bacterium 4484_113]|nr:MAG: hypothetical protein B1H03_00820 [Planctomycetales bacterium 4484_113]
MIPSRNLGLVLLLNLGFLYLAHWDYRGYYCFAGGLALIALVALIDYRRQRRESPPLVTRRSPDIWGVNLKGHYEVEVVNNLQRRLRGEFAEDWSESFPKRMPDSKFNLVPGEARLFRVEFAARERGEMKLGPSYLRYGSPWGWWLMTRSYDRGDSIKIYPSITDYIAFEPFLHRRRWYQRGLQVLRQHGEGTDFDSLRDYHPDDAYRKVNWKATARLSRPIVTQYRAEQNREIVVALDSGRNMFAPIGGRTRFDLYLDAVVQVSYASRLQNDRLGVLLFDREVRFYHAPTRRPEVLAELYPFHPRHRESDFANLYAFLQMKHPRRALIFILTEIADCVSGARAMLTLEMMNHRHQVIVVMLDTPEVSALASESPRDENGFYLHAAALSYLQEKQRVCRRLRRGGIEVVRTFAERLNLELVNRYLSLKARQLA